MLYRVVSCSASDKTVVVEDEERGCLPRCLLLKDEVGLSLLVGGGEQLPFLALFHSAIKLSLC